MNIKQIVFHHSALHHGPEHYTTLRDALVTSWELISAETFDFLWRQYNFTLIMAQGLGLALVFVARLRRRVWERRHYAPGGEGFSSITL
jgi:hypothetical protein